MEAFKMKSKLKALLLLIAVFSGIILIISVVSQSSVLQIEHAIIEYAKQHYFVIGLLSFIVLTISLALFRAFDERILKRAINKNKLEKKL